MSRTAAFFDLDGTLLEVNSGRLWFRRERAAGRLPLHQAVEAGVWLGLYSVGMLRARTALGRAVRTLAGQSEEQLAQRTREFFEEELKDRFALGGLAALEAHRDAGDPVVLLTSASSYLARCVQEHLALDDVLSMSFEVQDGRLTGKIDQLCYGAAKVSVAERWAAEHDVDMATCWFYTDSVTDLPMLERAGRPMVVRPDPRLARIAKRRGWPILDWSSSGGEHA